MPRATLRRTSSRREIGRSAHDQKFADAADAEETYHDAIRRTLEKTEALEKHVKTVTMRANSLATTDADFFQTLIERQEVAMRELDTVSTPVWKLAVFRGGHFKPLVHLIFPVVGRASCA